MNSGLYFANVFSVGIESILIFLFFGTNRKNLVLWADLIINTSKGTRFEGIAKSWFGGVTDSASTNSIKMTRQNSREGPKTLASDVSIELDVKDL